MKKVNKSACPDALSHFTTQRPHATWEQLRKSKGRQLYKEIKQLIFTDQGELCAYCERNLKDSPQDEKQVEHFHSKSDDSIPNKNWALDWDNMLGVCTGGKKTKATHPLPENLSCDAYTNHLEMLELLPKQCEGYILNPLDILASPSFFKFDKATGRLEVNLATSSEYTPRYNQFDTVAELVSNTINAFNLNCDRLNKDRLEIFNQYQHQIMIARQRNDEKIHEKLTRAWFNNQWPSFFTTRRILLGSHSELYLTSIQYNG